MNEELNTFNQIITSMSASTAVGFECDKKLFENNKKLVEQRTVKSSGDSNRNYTKNRFVGPELAVIGGGKNKSENL
jgi:hypothetical protein